MRTGYYQANFNNGKKGNTIRNFACQMFSKLMPADGAI